MDNLPQAATASEQSVAQELNVTRAIINEIRAHVMETKPLEANEKNPRGNFKLANLKTDIKEINRSLEEILQSVILL